MFSRRLYFVPAYALSWLVWAAVAFSAVAWGLRWSAGGTGLDSAASVSHVQAEIDSMAVARSLGGAPLAAPATPSAASRFQLVGVVAGGPLQGAALLAVDGKPAKPYRVGAVVAQGWVLQSVQAKRVSLGAGVEGPTALTLDLPVKNQLPLSSAMPAASMPPGPRSAL